MNSADAERVEAAIGRLEQLTTEVSLDDRIRAIAGLIGVALAILTILANRRLIAFDEERADLEGWSLKVVGQILVDGGLFLLILAALLAVAPIAVEVGVPEIGRSAGALQSVFMLIVGGLVILAALQGGITLIRIYYGHDNRKRRKAR